MRFWGIFFAIFWLAMGILAIMGITLPTPVVAGACGLAVATNLETAING